LDATSIGELSSSFVKTLPKTVLVAIVSHLRDMIEVSNKIHSIGESLPPGASQSSPQREAQ